MGFENRLAGLQEIIRDTFDIVIIGTPPDTHVELAVQV